VVLARTRVRNYWPTIAWSALLLLLNMQSWWAMFGLRLLEHWTFPAFSILMLQTVLQYMLAAIVFPDFQGNEPVNLHEHYWTHTRWFFSLLVFLLLVSLTKDYVIGGRWPTGANLLFHLSLMTPAVAALFVRSEMYHRIFSGFALSLFSAYIVALFTILK
jgi:hypothetical protein